MFNNNHQVDHSYLLNATQCVLRFQAFAGSQPGSIAAQLEVLILLVKEANNLTRLRLNGEQTIHKFTVTTVIYIMK